ncbi:MAG: FtsX-like permease family protein [Acidimicrobiia bacterium]|nr:FtsX-like permease family protein [Acidimicrobiia bacterium]
MFKAALKGLAGHKGRLIRTTLSIVAGVAFVAGTFILTDTLRSSFDDLFGILSETIDAQVRSEAPFTSDQGFASEREPVPAELVAEIQALPEVEVAEGSVWGWAIIVDKQGTAIKPQAPQLGFSWSDEASLNIADLRTGRAPETPSEVTMDAGTAVDNGFVVGDRVSIITATGTEEFTLVGTFGFDEVDNLLGSTNVAWLTPTAQRVMGIDGFVDINVAAADGTDSETLLAAIQGVLPAGVEVISQDALVQEQTDLTNSAIDIFNTALLVFAGVALFVGAFTIANTFSIIVAQRTREMALYRAVGATGGQVQRMVLLETLIIAVTASAIGVAAGALVAAGLKGAFSAAGVDLPAAGLVFKARTVIVGMTVGVVVTTLAAIVPAITASRVPPIAAMRDMGHDGDRVGLRRLVSGGAVTAIGVALLVNGLYFDPPYELAFVGAGALVFFLGIALLSPLIAGRMARIIGFPARRLFGMTGKLARENAGRRPVRTAATAGALMIGIALVSFFLIFNESLKVSFLGAIDNALAADLVVGGEDDPPSPISQQVALDLEALPEVAIATGVRIGEVRIDGASREVRGVDPTRILAVTNVEFIGGGIEGLAEPGTMIVRDDRANEKAWSVGDTVSVEFVRTGMQPLEVVGIYEGEEAFTGNYILGHATFDANFTGGFDAVVFADFAEGITPEQGLVAIRPIESAYSNVNFQSQAEYKASFEESLDQALVFLTVMLVLALLIALLGITNTLALSVFERTREIGLLRAVGMTRRQVRRMIRYEALIVAVFGAVLGVGVGLFFGWVVVQASAGIGIDRFAVPVAPVIVVFVIAAFAGILAATSPARKAAKMNVLDAIAYE